MSILLAALPAAYQLGKGLVQKAQAKKVKKSDFIPEELLMNRDLASQQAYSRRAPGQSQAEENVRRTTANRIAAGQRSAGGDANKMAAIASGAAGQANDANARIAEGGQRFSENAIGRLGYANTAIAGQKRQNQMEYEQTVSDLDAAGDQNIFGAINNFATSALASGAFDKMDPNIKAAANEQIAQGKFLNKMQAGRGAGGGNPYIKAGRQMKRNARGSFDRSSYLMSRYPQNQHGPWNMPGASWPQITQ